MDFLKASILISTGCSVVMAGVSVFALKQNAQLNQTIAQGTAQLEAWNQYKSRTPLAQ